MLSSTKISFGTKYPFENLKEQQAIVDKLNLQGISNKVLQEAKMVISGKDLIQYKKETIGNIVKSLSDDVFIKKLDEAKAEFRANKKQKGVLIG